MKKYKPKEIFCPLCHSHVGTWDGRSTSNYITKCGECKKLIVYHVETGETEIKSIPKRNCSSGMVFM